MQRLRDQKLYVKFSKYEFWLDCVTFLGHMVSADDIFRNLSKVKVVIKWQRLKLVKDVRSLLGLVNYYWWFIEDFSKLAWLLTKWADKGVSFQLSSDCKDNSRL